jgi:HrpA-like RNA helicase
VDEAHERDINIDILLVLLRRALALNPKLRVVVMSATINAELFQKYFNGAPMLHIPGFTYPVQSFFLEDLSIPGVQTKMDVSHAPNVEYQQVAAVIRWVDKNRPDGAILCFLPGWAEITGVARHLENGGSYCILPVHSRLSHEEQSRIFGPSVSGQRKIILATNIAETSITVNDVVYVIDTGAHKEER